MSEKQQKLSCTDSGNAAAMPIPLLCENIGTAANHPVGENSESLGEKRIRKFIQNKEIYSEYLEYATESNQSVENNPKNKTNQKKNP